MNRTTLFITLLVLIVGCSKDPINYETTLVGRDGVYFTKDTNKPYSGPVFSLYENGQKEWEGTFKDGKDDGLWTHWDENGKKKGEETWKDGKMWEGELKVDHTSSDGSRYLVGIETYKNGIVVSRTNYNWDGTVKEVIDCDKGECE